MPTAKKIARRILKRINGVLTVVFVDAVTGEVLTNTDGYTFETADGMPGITSPSTTPPKEEAVATPTPRSSNNTSYDQGHKDWLAKRVPDDDSNPFDETDKQLATVQAGVDSVKGTLTDGLMGLGARLFGGAIGKGIGEDIGTDIRENGVTGAGDAVRSAGAAVQETVGGLGDTLKNGVANLFGGGEAPKPPSEVVTYSPHIATRRIPVSDEYITLLTAAVQSVDPRVTVQITSGGQPAKGAGPFTNAQGETYTDRTGSTRHDVDANGNANTADVKVFLDGELQTPASNPTLFSEVVRAASTVGFTGIGVHETQNFIHIGGGEPAFWGYGPEGGKAKYANPTFAAAYTEGVDLNLKGEGDRIIAEYTQAVSSPTTQTASTKVKDKGTVSPILVAAVDSIRTSRGLPPTQGVLGKGTNAADGLLTDPIPNGPKGTDSWPTFDAAYDPIAQTAYATPSPVQGQGTAMFEPPTEPTKIADNGFVPTPIQPSAVADLDQQQGQHYLDALLKTLNEAEGSPLPNSLFGYGEIDDLSRHPEKKVYYGDNGDFSTAAGLFQINKDTWNEFAPKVGVRDFSEESQWAVARRIAIDEYKGDTGRDLVADLATGNKAFLEQAYSSLANRWASLPKGVQPNSKMNDLLTSFETHSAFSDPAIKVNTPVAPVAQPKNVSEPVSAQGVMSKIERPTTPTSTPTSSGGFMGDKNAPKSSVTSNPTSTSSTDTSKLARQAVTQAASQKQTTGSGFVPRPQPTSTTSKISSPSTPSAPTKNTKTPTNQVTQTNTKISSPNPSKTKDKNK